MLIGFYGPASDLPFRYSLHFVPLLRLGVSPPIHAIVIHNNEEGTGLQDGRQVSGL